MSAKKSISNSFTVNTVEDGESAPYYFQEWFAWSNDASTSSVTTAPTIGGSWATSIPSQGSYAYLWRKSIRYVWNENTRQYSAETAQYFRMSGTNGTSIRTRGQVANASSRGNGTATIITDSGTQTITLSDGDAVTQLDNGHLYQWVTEGGGKWLDLGQFKGESGKTYYTHIAWATKVNYNSSGEVTSVEGFTPDKSPNDTTHLWMGVLVNESSGADPSYSTSYTWSYTKGVDGTSPYFADLNNEMEAIQCKHDGGVIADQTVSTVISMWKGSTVEPFAVDNIYRNGTQLTWDGNNNGVWPRISGSTVSLEFTTSASIADIDDFKITIHSTNNTSVTRELHFTINGVRSNAIYRLVPSHSQIVKKKDGTYEPSVNITCSVKKNENGSTSTPSSSEYTLEKSVNGGSYEAYSATAPSSITSDLKFRLKVDDVVVDLETIPLVKDGQNGDAGKTYALKLTVPSLVIPCDSSGNSKSSGNKNCYVTFYVDGTAISTSSLTITILSKPSGLTVRTNADVSQISKDRIYITYGSNVSKSTLEGVITFSVSDGTDTTYGSIAVMCSQDGSQGDRGKIGRFFYFGGVWENIAPTDSFVLNDVQAPYFEHTMSGKKRYHVYNPSTSPTEGTITKARMALTSFANKPWESMTNDFKYIITEAIFGAYAHFGANIINGDYRLSQYGYMRGFYDSKVSVNSGTQYIYFDDSDPFGDEDMFSKSENMVANNPLSDYEIPDSTHYVILGNNIEFAPSGSPRATQIENTFTSSCYYFRFKRTQNSKSWSNWLAFSSSYYFALSTSNVLAPSTGWNYSGTVSNLVPTEEKPYLWMKEGSSGTPFLVSSPQKSFTIEKGRYYAISIETENYDAGDFDIMIGTKNSNITVTSGSLKKKLIGDTLAYYGIFSISDDGDFTNANLWTKKSGLSFTFEAVYKAQFVPMLCEDLKAGKLVVNDIVARGELHGESLYFKHASAFHRVYVHDESILSIPHAYDGEITTIVLPSPTESNGRVIEVYSGLEDGQSWSPTWDGASSGDYFRSFVCNTGGVGAGGTWSATYVKFWSDGSYWYVLKAERVIYDSDNDRHLIQLISKTH